MRFFIDADLPNRAAEVVQELGHDATLARSIGLAAAPDTQIVAFATANSRCLITGDFDFADVRVFDPRQYTGIVVLTLPRGADTPYIEALIRRFFAHLDELLPLEGRLFVVTPERIRIR
ncbi:MAG TPA: DUF5615 family PIN-like protein [Thermoanaerobaculia bacterium]|nr:DUF5615 family PIN-like protein [Thermoanaerobaculia bacterium]